jgi:hypothetical protein
MAFLGNLQSMGGNFVSRLGGFGDDPNELLTPEEIQSLTPDQLATYNQRKAEAQMRGMRELSARLSDAFAGRDVGASAKKRLESRLIQEEAVRKRNEDIEEKRIREQLQQAIEAGNYDLAMSLAARIGEGATIQMLSAKERADRPEIIEGGRFTVTYNKDGQQIITPNQEVIDTEMKIAAEEAALKKSQKVMPSTLIGSEDEDFSSIQSLQEVERDLDYFIDAIENKKLEVSVGEDIQASIANTGFLAKFLDDEAKEKLANYNAFNRWKDKYVNETLRLNKGPQTEGDAIRAMNELKTAKTPEDVIRLLKDLKKTTGRSIGYTKQNINRRRDSAGVDPYDFSELSWRIIPE